MIEQVAASTTAPAPLAPSVVVSITLSASAILTALATLFRVARWTGHTDATQQQQTERLEEIRQDVREIRAVLLERK